MRDIHQTDDEGFIPGIFNYCDRWCEQCDFVDRCRVGIHELDAVEGGFKQRTLDEALAEMHENFASTITMLHDMARQHGFDLNDALKDTPENRASRQEWEEREQTARSHPLSVAAMDYAVDLHKWMKPRRGVFKQAMLDMAKKAEMGLAPSRRWRDAERLSHALELLERYSLPVASKTDRAVMGVGDGVDGYEEQPGGWTQTDWNGSAKVAGLLMERSLGAWRIVFDLVPSVVDDALPLVAQLKKAHALLLREFPRAMEFNRPGFDAPGR